MTKSAFYQLVGRAYCNGMAHGMQKVAEFDPSTALGRDGIHPDAENIKPQRINPTFMFNAKPQFDVSKAQELNEARKARRELIQRAAIEAGRAAGSSFRSSLSALSKGHEVGHEKPTAPKKEKGLWDKIKTGITNFSDRMFNMSKANYHLQSALDFNSYLNNLNNQSYLNDLNNQFYMNDFNNTGLY